MHFDSLTDITALDIMLDVSLHVMPVILPMDGICGLLYALVSSHRIVMVGFHDLILDSFDLGYIGPAFEPE